MAGVAYIATLQLWITGGEAFTNYAERMYRKILTRPIASGWVRR
jgi:hypothetical protein